MTTFIFYSISIDTQYGIYVHSILYRKINKHINMHLYLNIYMLYMCNAYIKLHANTQSHTHTHSHYHSVALKPRLNCVQMMKIYLEKLFENEKKMKIQRATPMTTSVQMLNI